jgi:hypothetical protein
VGSNRAEDSEFIKVSITTSFGGKVKPAVHCRKIVLYAKEPCGI